MSFLHDVFLFAEQERKDRLLEDFLAFPRFDIALDELYKPSGNLDLFDIKNRTEQVLTMNITVGYRLFLIISLLSSSISFLKWLKRLSLPFLLS